MKKPLALAGLSLFVLVGAAYPDAPQLHYAAAVMAGSTEVSGPTYRPCRRGPGDDRCIQLYERGVRTAYAAWLRDHGVGGPDAHADAPPRARHARRAAVPRHAPPRYAEAAPTHPAPARCVDGDRRDHRMHHPRMRHEEHRDRRDDARQRDQDYGGGEVRGM